MTSAILLSGGIGDRMGMGIPKQYLKLGGSPVICYSLETLELHPEVDNLVIVADEKWRGEISMWIKQRDYTKFIGFADPGETRQCSILNGLKKIYECCTAVSAVIIHDAARPLVSPELISRCLAALPGHDGVMPVLHAKDTYYLVDDNGRLKHLLKRSAIVAGQAPEVFDFKKYYTANMALCREDLLKLNGSTEIAVLMGFDIVTVEGDERNIKLTTPNDLLLAERYLNNIERRRGEGAWR